MESRDVSVLKAVCQASRKKRLQLLNDKRVQRLIREVAINTLRGNVKLSSKQLKSLKNRASDIRALARKKTSHLQRVKVTQKGGFIGSLLIPAVQILQSLLRG